MIERIIHMYIINDSSIAFVFDLFYFDKKVSLFCKLRLWLKICICSTEISENTKKFCESSLKGCENVDSYVPLNRSSQFSAKSDVHAENVVL